MNKIPIVEGVWYVPVVETGRHLPRWVLKIFRNPYDGRERIRYSRGGDRHYVCIRKSFVQWMKTYKASIGDGDGSTLRPVEAIERQKEQEAGPQQGVLREPSAGRTGVEELDPSRPPPPSTV